MKSRTWILPSLFLAVLSQPAMAQSGLPDEIDFARYQAIVTTLNGEISSIANQLAGLEQERSQLANESSSLRQELATLPGQIENLQRIIEAKKVKEAELTAEIQMLTASQQRLQADLNSLQAAMAHLNQTLRQEEAKAEQIANHLQVLRQEAAQAEARLGRERQDEIESQRNLQGILAQLQTMAGRINGLEQERRDLNANNARNQRELPQARQTLARLQGQIAPKKAEAARAENDLRDARAAAAQAEARVRDADNRLAPMREQKQRLEREIAPLVSSVNELTGQRDSLKRELDQLVNRQQNAGTERTNLEQKIAALDASIAQNNTQINNLRAQLPGLDEEIRTKTAELAEAQRQLAEMERQGRQPSEMRDLRRQVNQLTIAINELKTRRDQGGRTVSALENDNATKINEKNAATQQLTQLDSFLVNAQAQIDQKRVSLAQKEQQLNERQAELSPKQAEVTRLNNEIRPLEADRAAAQTAFDREKQKETMATATAQRLNAEVQRLENDASGLNNDIQRMEREVASFPQELRRLDNHIGQVQADINEKNIAREREEKLLTRIRQTMPNFEREVQVAQAKVSARTQDFDEQNRQVQVLRNQLGQRVAQRQQLEAKLQEEVRLTEDSVRRQQALQQSLAADVNQQNQHNNRLQVVQQRLPVAENRLAEVNSQIIQSSQRQDNAEEELANAQSATNQRRELYNRYLGEAKSLGTQQGRLGLSEGASAGDTLGKSSGATRGGSSGTEEAKFESILRAFVRGEIAGYRAGHAEGLASNEDAGRGEREGLAAGNREARDEAQQVLKPRFYKETYAQRLEDADLPEIETPVRNALVIEQIIVNQQAAPRTDITALSSTELNDSRNIVTDLDARIQSAQNEIRKVLELRTSLARTDLSYAAPTISAPNRSQDCQGVYKDVAIFIEACRQSFATEYKRGYAISHKEGFERAYATSFQSSVKQAFDQEIGRQYEAQLNEATAVGKAAGLRVGKEEIYQNRFANSRRQAYESAIVVETDKARSEAVNMVTQHLRNNGAAKLQDTPTAVTIERFGVASGNKFVLDIALKNAGQKILAQGAAQVRLISMQGPVAAARTQAPIAALAAQKVSHVQPDLGLTVRADARPGESIVLKGELIYPGNDYQSSRSEKFELVERVALNPSANLTSEFDPEPKVSNLFGIKKHDVEVEVTAKHQGLAQGYEISLSEVGSSYVEMVTDKIITPTLAMGQSRKGDLVYKLSRSARGKTVTLKITVRYGNQLISETQFQVRPD